MKFLFLAWKHPVEPLGLLYISGILKKYNHETKIAVIGQDNLDNVVSEFKPDVVAGSVMTGGQTEFMKIINSLKKNNNFLSLMGGSHPTFHPQALEEDGLDIVAQGECEEAIADLANNLEKNKDITKIKNLWVKKDGKIYKNEIRNLNESLDTLPFPDRDVAYEHKLWKDEPIRHFIACRGCAYKCTYCFSGDTLVHTEKGTLEIKDLCNHGEIKILDHKGEWKNINKFYQRKYKGDMISITPVKIGIPIKCTPNHKLIVFRNNKIENIEAKDITEEDKVCIPIPQEIEMPCIDVYEELKDIKLISYANRKIDFDKIESAIVLLEEGSHSNRQIASMVGLGNTFVSTINRNYQVTGEWPEEYKKTEIKPVIEGNYIRFSLGKNEVPNKIPVDKDFCRLVGYYLAEGNVSKHKKRANSYETVFTFGENEEEYVNEVMDLIEKIFKVQPNKCKDKSTLKVAIGNSIIGLLFKKLFGTGAKKKKITKLLNLKNELQLEILKGYIRGDGDENIYCATSSPTLANQLFLISYKLGFAPGLYKYLTKESQIGGRKIKSGEPYYVLTFQGNKDRNFLKKFTFNIEQNKNFKEDLYKKFDNYILLPIRNIKKTPFEGYVYNIEVDESHTYTANNLAVNNCFNSAIDKIYGGKGKWVRWRSVDNLVQEIKEVFQKHGGKFVYFQDDIFIMNKPWLKEFAGKYKKEINLPFHCHVRPNLVDETSVKLLKEAGCYSVHMALEAADDYIRNVIIKREMDKETVYQASRLLNQYGIKIMLQNILGLPESSLETDLETLKMNIECKPLYAWCSIFQPYPSLPLTEYAINRGLLEGDFKDIGPKFFETTIVKLENKKEIEHLQKWFAIAASHPILLKSGLIKILIKMPNNKVVRNFYKFVYNKYRSYKDNQLYGIKLESLA